LGQKIGLYVGNMKVKEYQIEEYKQALKDAEFAYDETGLIHEVKFVTSPKEDFNSMVGFNFFESDNS
jgi:hypothetical protein